jgi:hypothetical protein
MNNKHKHTFKVFPNLIIVSNESSLLGPSSDVWSTACLMNDILGMLTVRHFIKNFKENLKFEMVFEKEINMLNIYSKNLGQHRKV